MMVVCPTHKQSMKLVKAGISKRTHEPYDAFYACPVFTCKVTAPATDEPSYEEVSDKKEEVAAEDIVKEIATQADDSPMTKGEWKEKDRQIARLTLAKSYIQASINFDAAMENGDLDKWDYWIKTGEMLK